MLAVKLGSQRVSVAPAQEFHLGKGIIEDIRKAAVPHAFSSSPAQPPRFLHALRSQKSLMLSNLFLSLTRVCRVAKVTKKDKKAVKAGINGVNNKLQAFQGAAIREACHCLEKQPISRYKRRRTAQLMKVLENDFQECRDRPFHVISEFLKTSEGNLYSKCSTVRN